MPEKVTGYLATDGTFYNDEDLCRQHDAKLALTACISGGIKGNVLIDDVFDILHLYTDQTLEYLIARKAVLSPKEETKENEPDTRPIEVEK